MPITIGTNIASLRSQRNLSDSSRDLSKTFERLSSGLRINSASDDPAGLAIADSLRADRRVYTQGIRNFNDGISLLNIADSAIESLSNIVIRLKELAEQAANGTFSTTQRSALDKEAQALSKEYTRIAQSAKFNGIGLLDGSLGSGVRFQGGYGINGSILAGVGGAIGTGTFSTVTSLTTNAGDTFAIGDLNGDGFSDMVSVDYSSTLGNIYLSNGSGGFSTPTTFTAANFTHDIALGDVNGDGNLDIVTSEYNYGPSSVGVYFGSGNGTFGTRISLNAGANAWSVEVLDVNQDNIEDIIIGGVSNTLTTYFGSASGSFGSSISTSSVSSLCDLQSGDFNADGIPDFISTDFLNNLTVRLGLGNGQYTTSTTTGIGFASEITIADFNGDGKLDFAANASSTSIRIFLGNGNGTFQTGTSFAASSQGITSGDISGDGIVDLFAHSGTTLSVFTGKGDGTFNSAITYTAPNSILYEKMQLSDLNNDGVLDLVFSGDTSLGLAYTQVEDGAGPLLPFSLTSTSDSKEAITIFTKKLNALSLQRSTIGSHQSRIQVAISNLQSTVENFAAAESRIRDADIAEEAAKMIRLQILQQAATAILGQANLQPQIALTLLKGGGS